MKLKSVTIYGRGKRKFVFPINLVGRLVVGDIVNRAERTGNSLYVSKVAKEFAIELHKDGNYAYNDNGDMAFMYLFKEKILHAISLETEDDKSLKLDLPQDALVTTDISKFGTLYIAVSDIKTVDDFFDKRSRNQESDLKLNFIDHYFDLMTA